MKVCHQCCMDDLHERAGNNIQYRLTQDSKIIKPNAITQKMIKNGNYSAPSREPNRQIKILRVHE